MSLFKSATVILCLAIALPIAATADSVPSESRTDLNAIADGDDDTDAA